MNPAALHVPQVVIRRSQTQPLHSRRNHPVCESLLRLVGMGRTWRCSGGLSIVRSGVARPHVPQCSLAKPGDSQLSPPSSAEPLVRAAGEERKNPRVSPRGLFVQSICELQKAPCPPAFTSPAGSQRFLLGLSTSAPRAGAAVTARGLNSVQPGSSFSWLFISRSLLNIQRVLKSSASFRQIEILKIVRLWQETKQHLAV